MVEPEYVVWMDSRFEYVLKALKSYLKYKEKASGKVFPYLRIIIKDMENNLQKKVI